MATDFLDAHERHWEDAEILFGQNRLANADHLYGMSAECGLKRLMLHFGMNLKPNGKPEEQADRDHANKIWTRYETYRVGHQAGAAYALPALNPFDNWNVSQRYAPRTEFTRPPVEAHRQGAETIRSLIRQARKDGLL